MKIKLEEIIASTENLKALQEVKLPIKVSYRLMRLVNKLQPILNDYDAKRLSFIKELGTNNEDGSISVKEDKLPEFQDKLKELLSIEEEIDFIPFNIDEIGNSNIETKLLVSWLFE